MEKITLLLWRVRRPGTAGWRQLSWQMTESDARAWANQQGYEIEPVPGSEEVRQPENRLEAVKARLGISE